MSHNVGHLHPDKSQISLYISEVIRILNGRSLDSQDATFLHADTRYSDQTRRMFRLIWVFIGRSYKEFFFFFFFFSFVVAQIIADYKSLALMRHSVHNLVYKSC